MPRTFVNISKKRNKKEQVQLAVDDIIGMYDANHQPGIEIKRRLSGVKDEQGNILEESKLFNCCSGEAMVTLILTRDGIGYLSAITQETLKTRMLKAEALTDALYNMERASNIIEEK